MHAMNDRMRAIVEEARKLAPEERRELFDLLEAEFPGDGRDGSSEEIEAAWLEVVEQRIAAAKRGETTFVDADEVLARMRQLIR
jgi:hypothetical protein